MYRRIFAILAATLLPFAAHAQSNDPGPLSTPTGALRFAADGRGLTVLLDGRPLDRINARMLAHFDEVDDGSGTIARSLVQGEAGPVLYDFRRQPTVITPVPQRMTIRRVFWQGDEVVMQGSQGWYRLLHGQLTKLQSTIHTFH